LAYIIINKDYISIFEKELIFLDYIDMTLQEALKNSNFLDNLSLEKKEFYR
jgi:hypothetical protein